VNHTDQILPIIELTLNENECNKLAKQHRFIQRSTSKLLGHEFVKAMILPSSGGCEESLNGLCLRLKEFNSEAEISAQALAERINSSSAPRFMQEMFSKILRVIRSTTITKDPKIQNLLEKFTDIYIQDSSVCALNRILSKKFPGTNRGGKSGLQSQIKIDLIHSIGSGRIVDAFFCEGKNPDQALSKRILSHIKKGDLIIRDLGYFVIDIFKTIHEIGAFFLSRLLANVNIYMTLETNVPIDLGKYIQKYHKYSSLIDIKVFLGKARLPVRLILYKVPDEVRNKRLRDARKRSKATGRTLSNSKKTLAKYSSFVTNVSSEILSAEFIGTVYRLRWEIELIFKQWKSQLKVHVLDGVNINRIYCLIWGRLCLVTLTAMICSFYAVLADRYYKRELSPTKLISYLIRGDGFFKAIANNTVEEFLKKTAADLTRRLCKDKRKRKTMRDRVECSESYYEGVVCF
jgi:hypothetical protein